MTTAATATATAPRRADALRRITVGQGESRISAEPDTVLTTILGSCIAACLYDADAHVGGMNHFLLAEPGGGELDPRSMQRYGIHAMEVLINALLAQGAQRHRLRARLYGGATMHSGFRDIGGSNSRFARQFLRDERIALVAEDVGGTAARRLEFRAGLGLARCRMVTDAAAPAARIVTRPPPPPPPDLGDVEFF